MSSMKWGGIYLLIVIAFSAIYYFFWLFKPDSFIINSELNVHPFYDMNKLLWGEEKYDYRVGNGISLSELKKENDKYFLELSKNKEILASIESEMIAIKDELDKLSVSRESEIDENTKAYEEKMLAPFVLQEKEKQAEISNLEKKLPMKAKTQADVDLIRLVGDKRVELAEIRVKKAHQAYKNSEFILSNLLGFISQETRDKYAELNQRESDTYNERYQLEKRMRDTRSVTLDRIEKLIKEYSSKISIVDFFYFSVGISTTTTFGDLVANDIIVRAIISFQLILCIFIIGGFVNSVIVREANKANTADAKKPRG